LGVEALETRELLSGVVPGFTLSGGNLYRTTGSQQQLIDTTVENFSVANNQVYDLHYNGTLQTINSEGTWRDIGGWVTAVNPGATVRQFALTADGTTIVALFTNGYLYTASTNPATWSSATWTDVSYLSPAATAGASVSEFALTPDGTTITALFTNGHLYVAPLHPATWSSTSWSDASGPLTQAENGATVKQFAVTPDGSELIVLLTDGYIDMASPYTTNWSANSWADASGPLTQAENGATVKQFAVTPDGSELIVLLADGYIDMASPYTITWTANSWTDASGPLTSTENDATVKQFALTPNGSTVIALLTSGYLYTASPYTATWSNGSWADVSATNTELGYGAVSQFALTPDGSTIVALFTDGYLYTASPYSGASTKWADASASNTSLGNGTVSQLVVTPDGSTIIALFSNGYLYTASPYSGNSTKWADVSASNTKLGHGTVSQFALTPDGSTMIALFTNGHLYTTSPYNGSDTKWVDVSAGNTNIENGATVSQFALTPDGSTIIALFTNGYLYTASPYTGSSTNWADISASNTSVGNGTVSQFDLTPDGTTILALFTNGYLYTASPNSGSGTNWADISAGNTNDENGATVRQFALTPDGSTVIALFTNDYLYVASPYRGSNTNWTDASAPLTNIENGATVTQFALTPDGNTIIVLLTNGYLYTTSPQTGSWSGASWTDLAANILSFALTPDHDLIVLEGGGNLLTFGDAPSPSSSTVLIQNCVSYQILTDGSVSAVDSNGGLWSWSGTGSAVKTGSLQVNSTPSSVDPSEIWPGNGSSNTVVYWVSGLGGLPMPDNLFEFFQGVGAQIHWSYWNGFDRTSDPGSITSITNVDLGNPSALLGNFANAQCVQDMLQQIDDLPASENIILIGHSLGADTVLRVADGTTHHISLLATLDPVGPLGFRDTPPDSVLATVTYFYDRWQTNGPFPINYGSAPQITSSASGSLAHDFGIPDQAEDDSYSHEDYPNDPTIQQQLETITGAIAAGTQGQAGQTATPLLLISLLANILEPTPVPYPGAGPFTGHVAWFQGLGPSDSATNYQATIDWGDNNTSSGLVVPDGNGGFFVDGTHLFVNPFQLVGAPVDQWSNFEVNVQITGRGGHVFATTSTAWAYDPGAFVVSTDKGAQRMGLQLEFFDNFDPTATAVTITADGVVSYVDPDGTHQYSPTSGDLIFGHASGMDSSGNIYYLTNNGALHEVEASSGLDVIIAQVIQSFTLTVGSSTVSTTHMIGGPVTTTAGTQANEAPASAAAASHFKVSAPTSTLAGNAFSVTVTALDPYGNIAAGYTGTVQFSSTDGLAGLPDDYTFQPSDDGQHTFTVVLDTGTTQNVGVTGSAAGSTGETMTGSANIRVEQATPTLTWSSPAAISYGTPLSGSQLDATANAPGSFVYTPSGGTVLPAGTQALSVTFTPTDTTDYTAVTQTVQLTVDQATPTVRLGDTGGTFNGSPFAASGSVTGVAGINLGTPTFTYYAGPSASGTPMNAPPVNVGTYTVVASYAGTQDYAAAQSAPVTFTISPGAATQFQITAPASTTAGSSFSTTITALDAFGNLATGYTGTVHFTSSDPKAALPADYTYNGVEGNHAFDVTFYTAGTQTVTATDTATGMSATLTVTVNPGAATEFAPYTYPVGAPIIAGTSHLLCVEAFDNWSNVAFGYTGTVHFTSSDPKASVPADYTYNGAEGNHAFDITFYTAGTQTVTATDTATGMSATLTVTVNPGSATEFAPYTYPVGAPIVAGASRRLCVEAFDNWGNVAFGYAGTVHFTSSDPKASLPADYTYNGAEGNHAFSVTFYTAGTQTVSATDTVSGASGNITVTVNQATPTLTWSGPAAITYGTALSGSQLDATGDVPGSFVYTPAAGTALPAGTQTLSVTFTPSDTTDYTTVTQTVQLTVNQATPTVQVSDTGGIFNGSPFAAGGSVAGLGGVKLGTPTFTYHAGSSASGTPLAGAPTDAGTYTVVASYAGSQDYTSASAQKTFAIAQAHTRVSVRGGLFAYTGGAPLVSGSIIGVGGVNLGTPTFTYYAGASATGMPLSAAPVNPGIYTVVASYAGSQDYTAASASAAVTIRGKATLSVSGGIFTYNGQAQAPGGSVTGSGGISLGMPTFTYYAGITATGTPLAGAPVNAGTYTVVASYAGSAIYPSVSKTATITIKPAAPTVRVTGGAFLYNGQAHAATGSVTGVGGISLGAPTFTYYAGTTAQGKPLPGAPVTRGTYTVVASYPGSQDYSGAFKIATIIIK